AVYQRFGGIAGSAYFVGGLGMTVLAANETVVIPIRSGVGLRLGANVGYLKFTPEPTWNPFLEGLRFAANCPSGQGLRKSCPRPRIIHRSGWGGMWSATPAAVEHCRAIQGINARLVCMEREGVDIRELLKNWTVGRDETARRAQRPPRWQAADTTLAPS